MAITGTGTIVPLCIAETTKKIHSQKCEPAAIVAAGLVVRGLPELVSFPNPF
jgi:hypothetical protein